MNCRAARNGDKSNQVEPMDSKLEDLSSTSAGVYGLVFQIFM